VDLAKKFFYKFMVVGLSFIGINILFINMTLAQTVRERLRKAQMEEEKTVQQDTPKGVATKSPVILDAKPQMTLNDFVQETEKLIDGEKQYAQFVDETIKNAPMGRGIDPHKFPQYEEMGTKLNRLGFLSTNFLPERNTVQYKKAMENYNQAMRIHIGWFSKVTSKIEEYFSKKM
jgi:hypothetical protein